MSSSDFTPPSPPSNEGDSVVFESTERADQAPPKPSSAQKAFTKFSNVLLSSGTVAIFRVFTSPPQAQPPPPAPGQPELPNWYLVSTQRHPDRAAERTGLLIVRVGITVGVTARVACAPPPRTTAQEDYKRKARYQHFARQYLRDTALLTVAAYLMEGVEHLVATVRGKVRRAGPSSCIRNACAAKRHRSHSATVCCPAGRRAEQDAGGRVRRRHDGLCLVPHPPARACHPLQHRRPGERAAHHRACVLGLAWLMSTAACAVPPAHSRLLTAGGLHRVCGRAHQPHRAAGAAEDPGEGCVRSHVHAPAREGHGGGSSRTLHDVARVCPLRPCAAQRCMASRMRT